MMESSVGMLSRFFTWTVVLLALTALLSHRACCHEENGEDDHPAQYLNEWGVEVHGGEASARRVAEEAGFVYVGPVGTLDQFHTFRHANHPEVHHEHAAEKTKSLHNHGEIKWAEQQKVTRRVKRRSHRQGDSQPDNLPLSKNAVRPGVPYPRPHDKLWHLMWYHHRRIQDPRPVWDRGFTGRGAVISILDDGIDYRHPDLAANYDANASYDYNSMDPDPLPRKTVDDENRHGTRCAGEASAILNNICAVGAAYNSSIGGVRMLDGPVTDTVEGHSLSLNPQHIDIYSSSWGPDDDGTRVDGPARLAQAAFKNGAEKGRQGKGSIFVWASGNGGSKGDSCGCDGYTNTIYSISVSAMSQFGQSPWYSEHCSSTLASTYSSGSHNEKKIVTPDLHNGCTTSHTGTSAAAPMAAGLLGLVVEANPTLTWRDMQHIVVLTSQPHPADAKQYKPGLWTTNGAGHVHSHEFGFGIMHTAGLVNLARHWDTVPPMRTCLEKPYNIDENNHGTFKFQATACKGTENEVRYAENIVAIITLGASTRGQVKLDLASPQGTNSNLLPFRSRDRSVRGLDGWRFRSVRTWGEDPSGEWTFNVAAKTSVQVKTIQLEIHGTLKAPKFVKLPRLEDCHKQCYDGCVGFGSKDCHSCKELTVFLPDGSFDCIANTDCPPGFAKTEKRCLPCTVANCWQCDSSPSSVCLKCSPGYQLVNNRCQATTS